MVFVMYISAVQLYDNLTHPELTPMQVFFRLDQTFFLDFSL